MPTLYLEVPKIKCEGCADAIQEALTQLEEVREVSVDIPHKTVAVTVDKAHSGGESVRQALQQAGFPAN